MSNDYYNYGDTLLPGQVALAEDVSSELDGIEAGLDLLPKPRSDGKGFAEPFKIVQATSDDEAANWGQLKTLEQTANASANNAAASESAAATSESNAATSETNAAASESAASTSETNAAASEAKAQEWATQNEDVEVEPGDYSAKHWAKKAEQISSGARAYQGTHDASGGSDPIATPSAGDEGKYWLISEPGTLSAGEVAKGDEYAINANLNYEIINLSSVYLQKSNNLSDLDSPATSRGNLGLGTSATVDTGTGANKIAQRDSNGDLPGDITGAAASATTASGADKLNTARNIGLGGDLSGSASFDGTSNITITASVSDDSHNHTISNVDGLQTELNGKLDNGAKAADSDKLDGYNHTAFLKKSEFDPANATEVWSGEAETVAISSLSEGGPGFYLVRYSSQIVGQYFVSATGFIYIEEDGEDYVNVTQSSASDDDPAYHLTVTIWYDGNNQEFFVVQNALESDGGVRNDRMDIDQIFKL